MQKQTTDARTQRLRRRVGLLAQNAATTVKNNSRPQHRPGPGRHASNTETMTGDSIDGELGMLAISRPAARGSANNPRTQPYASNQRARAILRVGPGNSR
eukprot:7691245-Lingulodinium_polyedra.AAC.1